MPYKKRGLQLLNDWELGTQFDPEVDRLLVTTMAGDVIVVRTFPEGEPGHLNPVIDPDFMPENLALIPHQLKLDRSLPLEWDATKFPWFIFLYDGEMTSDGPFIDMEAVGTGWTRPIRTDVPIQDIRAVRRDEIVSSEVSKTFQRAYFGEFNVLTHEMYNEALRP